MNFVDLYSEHHASSIGNVDVKYGSKTMEMFCQKGIKIRVQRNDFIFHVNINHKAKRTRYAPHSARKNKLPLFEILQKMFKIQNVFDTTEREIAFHEENKSKM